MVVAADPALQARTWEWHGEYLLSWDPRGDVRLKYTGFNTQPMLETEADELPELDEEDPLICVQAHSTTHRLPLPDDQRFHLRDRITSQYNRFKARWKNAKTKIARLVAKTDGSKNLDRRRATWQKHDPVGSAALERQSFGSGIDTRVSSRLTKLSSCTKFASVASTRIAQTATTQTAHSKDVGSRNKTRSRTFYGAAESLNVHGQQCSKSGPERTSDGPNARSTTRQASHCVHCAYRST